MKDEMEEFIDERGIKQLKKKEKRFIDSKNPRWRNK